MANILPVSNMIERPNLLGAAQQGYVYGQQQRAAREARADQQQVRSLAPQVLAGDPAATSQMAAIDPAAATQYQQSGDAQLRRIKGLIAYMEKTEQESGPQAAQAIWQSQGVPYVRQFSNGTEPTTDWQQAKQLLGGVKAKIAAMDAAQPAGAEPTGFRELHLKALAAGLQPGTPEYQQAMNIALGREGRAATGGFGFEKIVGLDGRERMGRKNPRTGVFEVYDEGTGDFVPLGSGANLNGGAPNGTVPAGPPIGSGGQVSGATRVSVEGLPPEVGQRIASDVDAMRKAGVSDEIIQRYFATSTGQAIQQPAHQGNPALGVGMSPAEKKYAEESAQQQAQLAVLRERGQIEAQNEADKAGAKQSAENAADRNKSAIAKAPQLQNVERGLDRIDTALSALEKGRFGDTGPMDQYYQQFTPEGQELNAAVGAIQNDMLALTRVPGIGSQSDMEAKIANLKYPNLSNDPTVNRRNLEQLRAFMRDLGESLGRAPQQPSVIRYDAQGNRL